MEDTSAAIPQVLWTEIICTLDPLNVQKFSFQIKVELQKKSTSLYCLMEDCVFVMTEN